MDEDIPIDGVIVVDDGDELEKKTAKKLKRKAFEHVSKEQEPLAKPVEVDLTKRLPAWLHESLVKMEPYLEKG